MKPGTPPPATAVAPMPRLAALRPGQLLLVYTPEGPVGGTFTCVACRAQAWQPDLLVHAADCTFLRPDPAPGDAPVTPP
jgi:hypothetical protein